MLNSILTKLGLAAPPPPPPPANADELAARMKANVLSGLAEQDHSLLIAEAQRGLSLSEDDWTLAFHAEDDMTLTLTQSEKGQETDRSSGLTEHQMMAELAEALHDHMTGWTPEYHAERRARMAAQTHTDQGTTNA